MRAAIDRGGPRAIRRPLRLRAVAATAVLCGWTVTAQAEWLFQFNAGAIYDSNLTGAAEAVDVRPGWAAAVEASASQFFALSSGDGLTLTVNLRGEMYDRYDGLDFAAIG